MNTNFHHCNCLRNLGSWLPCYSSGFILPPNSWLTGCVYQSELLLHVHNRFCKIFLECTIEYELKVKLIWYKLQHFCYSRSHVSVFRWFKFTLNPPYSITCGKLQLAIWDTSFWTFWLKFGHKGPWNIS